MEAENKEKLGAFSLIVAGLSFVPIIGVVFGIIAILWGAVTKKSGGPKLIILGSLGCWITVISYAALLYFDFMKPGGFYDDVRSQSALKKLDALVLEIESYKSRNGAYPAALEKVFDVRDPTSVNRKKGSDSFYYALTNNGANYYLLGVGKDGVPFTADDLLPDSDMKGPQAPGLTFMSSQCPPQNSN